MKLLLCFFLLLDCFGRISAESFADDQYHFIMDYIKTVSKQVHDVLWQCELDRKQPCIQKVETILEQGLVFPQGDAAGYFILNIFLNLGLDLEGFLKSIRVLVYQYNMYMSLYGNVMPLLGRQYILKLIERLDISLYNYFGEFDPTGVDHIRLKELGGSLIAVSYNPVDGLPLIVVDSGFIRLSLDQQLFAIGHELAHYVLQHLMINKNIKISGLIDFKSDDPLVKDDIRLLKNSWRRVNEYEADRFAVLEFGAKIEDAITLIKSKLCDHDNIKSTNVFDLIHPSDEKRIEQLLGLSVELELKNKRPKKLIDWGRLAHDYRDFSTAQMSV